MSAIRFLSLHYSIYFDEEITPVSTFTNNKYTIFDILLLNKYTN